MSLITELLSQPQARTLYSANLDGVTLCVREFGNYRWLQCGGEAIQSVMKLDAPDDMLSPVGVGMLAALALAEAPNRVLNLGFGMGSFERFFRAQCPSLDIVSVEPGKAIVDLARRYFFIPEGLPVINASAEQYLEDAGRRFDVMLCDIFAGEAHPACLKQPPFYQQARRNLEDSGILALNLLTQDQGEVVEILVAMRDSFPWTALYEVPGHGNVIVFACARKPGTRQLLEKRAAAMAAQTGLDLAAVIANLHELPLKQ